MDHAIVIDIETQWTDDMAAIDAAVPAVPPASDLVAPSNYRDPEKIAAWHLAEHARLIVQRAEDVQAAYRATSLDALQGAVLCVGISVDAGDPICIWESSEAATLERLQIGLNRYPDRAVVGWNSLSFDWPFLFRRALRHGLYSLARRLYYSRPYNSGRFVDLYSAWCAADRRAKGKLYDVARHLRIEVTETVPGAQIPELWHRAQGTPDEDDARAQIVAHAVEDVRVTREIARIFALAGMV